MTVKTKVVVAGGLLVTILFAVRLNHSSSTHQHESVIAEVRSDVSKYSSGDVGRPIVVPPPHLQIPSADLPSADLPSANLPNTDLDDEGETLPTATFESVAAESEEFADEMDAAKFLEVEQQITGSPTPSEPVDPTSEGFESIEEMEAFVREKFDVQDDVEIQFSKTIDGGEERLSIAFVPLDQ